MSQLINNARIFARFRFVFHLAKFYGNSRCYTNTNFNNGLIKYLYCFTIMHIWNVRLAPFYVARVLRNQIFSSKSHTHCLHPLDSLDYANLKQFGNPR